MTLDLKTRDSSSTTGERHGAILITAIVLVPDLGSRGDPIKARDSIVRSLVWLVSAVVSGVVREVILAVPDGLDLVDVVDQSGCDLVYAERAEDRLAAAIAKSRCERLLVIRSGYLPEAGLVDELASILRREHNNGGAILRAAPETGFQRLFPNRAPAVGVLLSQGQARRAGRFEDLPKAARDTVDLHARARRID